MNEEGEMVNGQEDFSLVLGGPLYQLFLRTQLIRPTMEFVYRRIVASILLTWLPLFVLTALAGTLLSGVAVPFLHDLDVHVKCLIVLPLLIGAELIVHRRMRVIVAQFTERGLIAPEDCPRFEAAIASAMRMRNSVVVELVLLALAFSVGYWVWRTQTTLPVATWYALPNDGSINLTWPGYWYAFVTMPIGRFIFIRWYYRLFIWYVFLWRVARLPLRLNPLHPDRAGGLGFLENSVTAFTPVLIAQSAMLSGLIATKIWHTGTTLPEYKYVIAGFMAFLMMLVLTPLTFFVYQLVEAQLAGGRAFGGLASRYVGDFRRKWLAPGRTVEESPLGTEDIQTLADLANSYEVVRTMRPVPFDKGLVLRLAIMLAIPLLPLVLTMIPVDELAERLFKLIV